MEAQHSREAEAAAQKQEEVDITAKVAAETLRRMEVPSCALQPCRLIRTRAVSPSSLWTAIGRALSPSSMLDTRCDGACQVRMRCACAHAGMAQECQ